MCGMNKGHPLNLFPKTIGHTRETSMPATIVGHFSPIMPAVVSEGIIQLTTTLNTTMQEQMWDLQVEVDGRGQNRTRRPPQVPNPCSSNPQVTTTARRRIERPKNTRTRRERVTEQGNHDLNQPTSDLA
uniref:Uncharacterized protein n=1 Tax=Cannabis sativa TaxID=3483 RepID=A0A803NU68_CANSA